MMKEPMATNSPHSLARYALIAFASLILLVFVLGTIALFRGGARNSTNQPTPTAINAEPTRSFDPIVPTADSPTVTPRPITRVRKYIYTIESTGPRKVGDLTIKQEDDRSVQPRMDDNGVLYYLESGDVYSYSLATQEKQLLYRNANTTNKLTDAVMSRTGKLFISARMAADTSGLPKYSVFADALNTAKSYTVGPIEPVPYGSVRYLFNTDYGDIIISEGGDGCAPVATIMKIKDERTDIVSTGQGCTNLPLFVGYDPDIATLYLAERKPDTYPDTEYTSFNAMNVVLDQTVAEYDLTSLGEPVRYVLMDGTDAVFLTDSYAVRYDITSKSTNSKVSIPKPDAYAWVLGGTMLYGSPFENGKNIAINLINGSMRNIAAPAVKSEDYRFKYLGMWKKRPIFYVDATE